MSILVVAPCISVQGQTYYIMFSYKGTRPFVQVGEHLFV